MELTISAVWFSLAFFAVTAIITKIASRRVTFDHVRTRPPPPEVKGIAVVRLLPTLRTKGPAATMHYLYDKFGSVFTVSFLWKRITFLVGREASGMFFGALDSEVSHGDIYEFTVPVFGPEMGFAVDYTTRTEQNMFFIESLKPAQLRNHVDPMLQEVENYFAKWGEEGVVDLKDEFQELLMLISCRCLVGKEARENMFGQFCTLFRDIEKGLNFVSFMFPYIPTPTNRRRDRARSKLAGIISEIVRSRKSSNPVKDDVLQRLINSTYKSGRATTVTEVSGLIIALITAGKHTSTHTSMWTGACLLSSTNFLEAAVEEQKQIIRKHQDMIDYNVLSEMGTLHSCIKEAVRMYPPVPMLIRKVQKDINVRTEEGNEYVIPKGNILVNLVVVNGMLQNIYNDPEVYDPDRFRPGREEDKVGGKFSFTSFGGGRHTCTGEAYAYMQIKIILSHLLRNFELKLNSSFPKPDWSKITPEPKGKVLVSYKRRCLSSN
ncbi:obtusifoliol 14-alpha demethylase-like [Lolium rigidum]|uniref:obtusifoliol 14-alpha demethylase-like n=1 Tax=Lolium rigidum TaxID=89674 RepID=UPI001F5CBF34|nr:obtusifoliol 14-alpha demethylase-like [Lolium rigidum]